MDIRITVNDREITLEKEITVDFLLQHLGYSKRVAVWINGDQLLLADYPSRTVGKDDQIKIRRIVAGG